MTTIYLTQEFEGLGKSLAVDDTPDRIASKLKVAKRQSDPSITVTLRQGNLATSALVLPLKFIGPVVGASAPRKRAF